MMPIAARKSIVSRSARIVVSVMALSWVNRICWRTQIINPVGAQNVGELQRVVGVERPPTLWLCLVHISALLQTVAVAAGE